MFFTQFVIIGNIGMDFPRYPTLCSVVNDLRLPARMQECFARLRIIMRLFLHSDFVEKFFNYTLHRIEVPWRRTCPA